MVILPQMMIRLQSKIWQNSFFVTVNKKFANGPVRTCINCRTKMFKVDLTRLVLISPDKVIIDRQSLNAGRGAYLCKECLEMEPKKYVKKLSRALRCNVKGVPVFD